MPILAVLLVLASCVIHAAWNLLLKRARDKAAFTALYLCVSSVVYLPMFLWLAPHARITAQGWACIVGTGILYAGYFIGLAQAYESGELSVAYPLVRGVG